MKNNLIPIPIIGVPVVNGVHWVDRLIKSIDYPVDNLLIINNNGKGEIDSQLDDLKEINNKFVKKLHIIHFPSNLGVASSWNLIIKLYLMEPYWVICSHDVAFTPGLLEEIAIATLDKEVAMIHPHKGQFNLGSYDLFVITEKGVRDVGLFDENLYPAYAEDSDFIMRLNNIQPKMVKGLKNIHLHGNEIAKADDEHYKKNGMQTKKENEELAMLLNQSNEINGEYLAKKWGNGWRTVQPHWNPFCNAEYPQSYITWDLDFVRSKYLGF